MHKLISNYERSVKLPMANFSETTSFILSHKDVVFGIGLPIESAANGDKKFTLSVESNGKNTGGFTLGGVTARIVHDTAPSNPQTPAGYRLTIRVKKGESHDFALPVAAVAQAVRNSEPVLGYALDLNPGAAKTLVDAVGLSVVGMASAHQKDVDKDAVATTTTIFSKINLPSGRKPPL
jgi:hypothetical protein